MKKILISLILLLTIDFSYAQCEEKQTFSYPRIADELREQGRTILELTFDDDGVVSNVKIIKSSGYKRLDDAAKKYATKFKCAYYSNKTFQQAYLFKLDETNESNQFDIALDEYKSIALSDPEFNKIMEMYSETNNNSIMKCFTDPNLLLREDLDFCMRNFKYKKIRFDFFKNKEVGFYISWIKNDSESNDTIYYSLKNNLKSRIKDISLLCSFYTKTDTFLYKRKYILYEYVNSNQLLSSDFQVIYEHKEAKKISCEVTAWKY